MRVVVLARKNVAAMKTGARHLLRSVGVLSPSTGTQFFPSAFANDTNHVVLTNLPCIHVTFLNPKKPTFMWAMPNKCLSAVPII